MPNERPASTAPAGETESAQPPPEVPPRTGTAAALWLLFLAASILMLMLIWFLLRPNDLIVRAFMYLPGALVAIGAAPPGSQCSTFDLVAGTTRGYYLVLYPDWVGPGGDMAWALVDAHLGAGAGQSIISHDPRPQSVP